MILIHSTYKRTQYQSTQVSHSWFELLTTLGATHPWLPLILTEGGESREG